MTVGGGGGNNKPDKARAERQAIYKEAVFTKLSDENKHHFTIKWRDELENLAEVVQRKSSVSIAESDHDDARTLNSVGGGGAVDDANANNNENTSDGMGENNSVMKRTAAATADPANMPSSLDKYNTEFKNYLQNFNAVVVNKVKAMVEKRLQEEALITQRPCETAIYQEATRHVYKLQNLLAENLIDSNDYVERLRRLIGIGAKSEHYPIFLHGGSLSGKSTTLSRYGALAYKMVEPCLLVVRFAHLTNHSSNFESMLYSMCEQLCVFQKLNPLQEVLVVCFNYFYLDSKMSQQQQQQKNRGNSIVLG
jgi:hypothetical protein